jgi:hypothetical protein
MKKYSLFGAMALFVTLAIGASAEPGQIDFPGRHGGPPLPQTVRLTGTLLGQAWQSTATVSDRGVFEFPPVPGGVVNLKAEIGPVELHYQPEDGGGLYTGPAHLQGGLHDAALAGKTAYLRQCGTTGLCSNAIEERPVDAAGVFGFTSYHAPNSYAGQLIQVEIQIGTPSAQAIAHGYQGDIGGSSSN